MKRARKWLWLLVPVLIAGWFGWFAWRQIRRDRLRAPLFTAIRDVDPALVEQLLDRGADANDRDKPVEKVDLVGLFRKLFRKDPKDDASHPTALITATSVKSNKIAALLLERGADPNAAGIGTTPLQEAAWNCDSEMVRLLVRRGAKLETPDADAKTPLILAAEKGLENIKTLVELGASAKAVDHDGHSSIFYVAKRGLPAYYRPLLEHGADPNTTTDNGGTLLVRAIDSGRPDLVKLLLQNHADPNKPSGEGQSEASEELPIFAALRARDRWEYESVKLDASTRQSILSLLLDAGADANASEKDGGPPLHIAVEHGWVEEARMLLDKGASVNGVTDGSPLLLDAVLLRDAKMARLLLERGAKVDAPDRYGTTPLMVASFNGDADIVRDLVARGADPKKADAEGVTALRDAADSPRILALLRAASSSPAPR